MALPWVFESVPVGAKSLRLVTRDFFNLRAEIPPEFRLSDILLCSSFLLGEL